MRPSSVDLGIVSKEATDQFAGLTDAIFATFITMVPASMIFVWVGKNGLEKHLSPSRRRACRRKKVQVENVVKFRAGPSPRGLLAGLNVLHCVQGSARECHAPTQRGRITGTKGILTPPRQAWVQSVKVGEKGVFYNPHHIS